MNLPETYYKHTKVCHYKDGMLQQTVKAQLEPFHLVHCMYTYTDGTQECICTKAWVGFGKTMLGSVVVCQ